VGGAAYLIRGRLAQRLIPDAPLPAPSTVPLWRRLLGAPAVSIPGRSHVVVFSNGDRHFEILPGSLEEDLVVDFKKWLFRELGALSRASAVVVEYLEFGGPSIHVRGLQRSTDSKPSFWIQLSFSGCAGEAQVSADVAAHWAACWHRARRDEVRDAYLLPFGFTPEPHEGLADADPPFLPAGDLGYLEFTPPESRERDRMPLFVLDHSLEEAFAGQPCLDRLEERFARFMTDGTCRCQLCEPGLGDLEAASPPHSVLDGR
jgi:hypothetical protein